MYSEHNTHTKPEIYVPSERRWMLLNIRNECFYCRLLSKVNDKTGFCSSTYVLLLITLSLCNLSTVGCWECKSISHFLQTAECYFGELSYAHSFKCPLFQILRGNSKKCFMRAKSSHLQQSKPYFWTRTTYQSCTGKNREHVMSKKRWFKLEILTTAI